MPSDSSAILPEVEPIGTRNGVSRSRAFDRWFRYPAGFSEEALRASMDKVGNGSNQWLVDPFAGSASSGTAAIGNGWRFAGIEAHPAIAELGDLKFARPGKPANLKRAAVELIADSDTGSADLESDLVLQCFDEPTLERLVGLRDGIQENPTGPWSAHLKWALLGCLRDVASVKVGWPYQRPGVPRRPPHRDVERRFLQRVDLMVEDLEVASSPSRAHVVSGDSRLEDAWHRALGTRRAGGCITSPPYLNNFDYADATRLEMYFWGYARSWSELCEGVRSKMLTATTQQTRRADSDAALEGLVTDLTIGRKIGALALELSTERVRRGRGKEYDRILGPYFLGIGQTLGHLFKHLAPGSTAAWIVGDSAPYGIYIDTPLLIAELASEVGFVPGSDEKIRTRGLKWRTNGTRHQVELSERLITFSKPSDGHVGRSARARLFAQG